MILIISKRTCLLALAFSFLSLNVTTTLAALPPLSIPGKINELKKRRAALTSKRTFKKLQRAHNLMGKDQYKKAQAILDRLLKNTKKHPFEQAQVLQTLAYLYAQQDQIPKAIRFFEQALNLKALPSGPTLSMMYTTAQILASQGKNLAAQKRLREWFSYAEKPQADAYVLYATLLFDHGDKKGALTNLNHALDLTKSPQEKWLKMAVALNFETGNYKKAEQALRQLVEINPSEKKYWKQLAGTYLNLNNFSKSLAALELAHKWGLLSEEKELINLVSLYLQENIPLKAAQLLNKYIKSGKIKKNKKHYQLLSQAWIQAEEPKKAFAPLKEAAKFSKDGEIDIQLGQLHMEKEDWKQAVIFLEKGLKKGGLKHKNQAHLIAGIAFFQVQNKGKALKHLKMATNSEKTEKSAQKWISHVQQN